MDGTCIWIKDNESYKSWLCSASRLLWLSGGPGKGKTMLSIFLSEELEHLTRQSHSTIFLEYYCDNKNNLRNSAIAILRGLLYQLLKSRPSLFKHIESDFQIQGDKLFKMESSSFPSLWKIFCDMVQDPDLKSVYCVLDGLDECDEESLKLLLCKLKSLFLTKLGPNTVYHLKMILISRDLSGLLPEVISSFPCITLDINTDAEINHDIHRFIEVKINELSKHRRYPDQLCAHVKEVFRERAQGTFLWIGIAAQELSKYIATEVEEALKSFPRGLEPLFARMLLQIKPERRQTIAQILRWVVVAARPLTVLELSIALKQSNHDHNHDHTVPFSREEVIRDQISSCVSLLNITKHKVKLVHQSVKDYLLRKISDSNAELEAFRIKEDEGHLELARRCFYYLQDVALIDEEPVKNPRTFRMRSARREGLQKGFPLLSYAMQYWPMHASALRHNDDIFDVSHRFYKDPKFCAIWRRMYFNFDGTKGQWIPYELLHIASYFNLKELAENIISKYGSSRSRKSSGTNGLLNKPDMDGSTPLHLAVERGHAAMCQLLLNKKPDIDAKDDFEMTALDIAAECGQIAVVRLLLDRGASTEAKIPSKQTPLHRAALFGHSAIVRLLLDRGASIEAQSSSNGTPLHYATQVECSTVARLLLDRGASIEAKNLSEETPLHYAAYYGQSAIVGLLLDRGAFVEAQSSSKETPLHCATSGRVRYGFQRRLAVKGWNLAVVRLLLDRGASTEIKSSSGETALHFATLDDDIAITDLLLKRGAFVEAENTHRVRPLHIAASLGFLVMVQLLLRHRADIMAKDKNGSTSLHLAAQSGHKKLVELLLNEGALIEARDKLKMTSLHHAAQKGRSNVVRKLLRYKANVNSQDCNGWTPLHHAARYKAKATVKLLVDKGVDLEMKSNDGETALHKATKLGCLDIVLLLLEGGALINAQDSSGCTAVYHAAKKPRKVTLRHLLTRGASTEIKNCDGLTVLQVVKKSDYNYKEETARLIEKFQNNGNANEQDEEDYSASDEANSVASDESLSLGSDDPAQGRTSVFIGSRFPRQKRRIIAIGNTR